MKGYERLGDKTIWRVCHNATGQSCLNGLLALFDGKSWHRARYAFYVRHYRRHDTFVAVRLRKAKPC